MRPWNGMNWIRQEKRLAIYLRDGLACVYCSQGVEDGVKLTLDHVKPHVKGGSNEATNLVTACKRCNDSRGKRSLRSFCTGVAMYLNNGIKGADIEYHVRNCQRRIVDVVRAKAMIEARGSVAEILTKRS